MRSLTIGPVMPGRSIDPRMHSVSSLSVLKFPFLLVITTAFFELTPLAITCRGWRSYDTKKHGTSSGGGGSGGLRAQQA